MTTIARAFGKVLAEANLEKAAFSLTPEGHKLDAERHRGIADALHNEGAAHQEYAKKAPIRSALISPPDTLYRQLLRLHEHAAKKHEGGHNAYNPLGGLLTPSSYEQDMLRPKAYSHAEVKIAGIGGGVVGALVGHALAEKHLPKLSPEIALGGGAYVGHRLFEAIGPKKKEKEGKKEKAAGLLDALRLRRHPPGARGLNINGISTDEELEQIRPSLSPSDLASFQQAIAKHHGKTAEEACSHKQRLSFHNHCPSCGKKMK
jgi:hypothetical protein